MLEYKDSSHNDRIYNHRRIVKYIQDCRTVAIPKATFRSHFSHKGLCVNTSGWCQRIVDDLGAKMARDRLRTNDTEKVIQKTWRSAMREAAYMH